MRYCEVGRQTKYSRKNDRHGNSNSEAEQVFFNIPILLLPDAVNSSAEVGAVDPGMYGFYEADLLWRRGPR